MRGFTLNQWSTRSSPSKWMKDILKATPADVRYKVKTAIEHAVWAAAARTEEFSWEASSLLMWITRPELSATGTCSECSPLNGRREKRRKDFGVPYPHHPRCTCGIVPVSSQQKTPLLLTGLVCFVGRWIGTIKPLCFFLADFLQNCYTSVTIQINR